MNVTQSRWTGRAVCVISLAGATTVNLRAQGAFALLFSLPVALAALVDGWRGGIIAAAISSAVLYISPAGIAGLTLTDSFTLFAAGLLIGLAVEWEQRKTRRLRNTADQLSSVYERVQANFEGMKRVERLSAIGQLSAGLAHEVRNPLASIAGAAEILQRAANMDERQAKCIGIISSECRRLNGLLTNFLNFARPRAPRLQLVNLEQVLDNVLTLASHGVSGKAVSCEKRTEMNLPQVECDPEQLEQVLLNLMINAIEASPSGETVTLAASFEDGRVAVRVIDHGHGVSPAHVERLFDPFFTTKEHGTGLGLSVAHQITTQMGGTLMAQRNLERGMTFSITLPAKQGGA